MTSVPFKSSDLGSQLEDQEPNTSEPSGPSLTELPGDSRRGRPPKGYVNFHAGLPPEVKAKIDQLADLLECSQGEVVSSALAALISSFKNPRKGF